MPINEVQSFNHLTMVPSADITTRLELIPLLRQMDFLSQRLR